MTAGPATVEDGGAADASFAQRYYDLHPVYRLVLRWGFIIAATAVAFHQSLLSLIEVTRNGSLGGYVWTVLAAAILVAFAVARRRRTELPIHDRQTDIIVGLMAMGVGILIQWVLLPRYDLYFLLLRLDLVAMWLFVTSSAVLLFGLRPVIRFAWVWGMLLMVFPLPYYLAVLTFGGGKTSAGAATLLISGVGAGIAMGTTYRRGFVASVAAWVIGFALLAVITIFLHEAPLLVYQQVPALAALCVVGAAGYLLARRGQPKRVLERKVEPIAAKQVWAGLPLVLVCTLALAQFQLPNTGAEAPAPRSSPYPLRQGMPMVAPPGWTTQGTLKFPVSRMFGPGAVLVRQQITADVGNPRWDKFSRPRTLVVDSTVSTRPYAFRTFPTRVLYGLTSARISEPDDVQLSEDVQGRLISVVDDDLLVTWNSLELVWGDDELAQRVTVFAVDNHELGAPFPEPTQSLLPSISTLLTLLFRGNDVLFQEDPTWKDAALLTTFGRALVAAQTGSSA
ncbi:hypothetical protein [uncultured Mycolicibacterium sp.]|uniref:hypothetical protein n=1 Tax=uncultured Mycolicibacterium sp. TaxID=2320817 RepID=UPI0032B18693